MRRRLVPGCRLVFDLDRTLWPCTVEYHPRLRMPQSNAYPVLKRLRDDGHPLAIASRSAHPARCRYFLRTLFPDITFEHCLIYPTPRSKVSHLCAMGPPYDFVLFDDELDILRDVKRAFPQCTTVHCASPLTWHHVGLKSPNVLV